MTNPNELLWHDAREFTLEGKGWTDTEAFYDRLPARARSVVREPVWDLSRNPAGFCVRFWSDSSVIAARWTLSSDSLGMNHMPATGVSGLDLYTRVNRTWHWLGVGRPERRENQSVLADVMPAVRRDYLLYLPLYNGLQSLSIGVSPAAKIGKLPVRKTRPICIYGTSIVQGGCASRPGMPYPAILGRRLNRPLINLGFSGNGQMEPEMLSLLAELDPCVYVLDALPNLVADQVTERTEPGVAKLRAAHPDTPIVLVESITYQDGFLIEPRRRRYQTSNVALREAYEKMIRRGVKELYYVPGEKLLGTDGEGTVDGTHATDVGFLRMAAVLTPVLRKLV